MKRVPIGSDASIRQLRRPSSASSLQTCNDVGLSPRGSLRRTQTEAAHVIDDSAVHGKKSVGLDLATCVINVGYLRLNGNLPISGKNLAAIDPCVFLAKDHVKD